MRKTALLISLVFVLFLVSNVSALDVTLNTLSVKSPSPPFSKVESTNLTPVIAQYVFDLGITNIGMEQKPGSDWNDCPEFCEYWQFWVKVHNAGVEDVDCAFIIFTVNGQEIGREHIAGLYPSEVRKLLSPEFHIDWPEKCTEFLIDAHVEWPPDENPENDRIEHIKYVSGHVDTCYSYDDGGINDAWTWLPGLEYPDYAMASKWQFDEAVRVVYVEFWLSQTTTFATDHVEFFVWAEDPNNPGYPLDRTPDDIIYRAEYELVPNHYWRDAQYVCFPVCLDVQPSQTYFFGYCNRQGTIQFLCIDVVEDYPDRNLFKQDGVWYTGPHFGDWFIHPCAQTEWVPTVTLTCETLTPVFPVFCRGKHFYFSVTVNNETGGNVSGTLTFSSYSGYDCDPSNLMDILRRSKTFGPGVTETYYYLRAPYDRYPPGQYSASVGGTLSGYDLFCCMNGDIIECGPFKNGDNTEWGLVEVDREDVEAALPVITSLAQNYPNPFNAETNISFSLAEAGNVSLNVYDITGRLVTTLVDGQMDAGQHVVVWDASSVSSGVYFYKLSTGDYTAAKSMNLLK